jgi:hypothetical protein
MANNSISGSVRSRRQARKGEKLFKTYDHVLSAATDWGKVGWIKQVSITKWIACRHQLASHAPIDDCLDELSYNVQKETLSFKSALDRCVRQAKQEQAKQRDVRWHIDPLRLHASSHSTL